MSPAHVVFVHSSNEMYGADRMLLEVIRSLPSGWRATVLLPNDVASTGATLAEELDKQGVPHVTADLAILRRAYLTPRGLLSLARRIMGTVRLIRTMRPSAVYLTTSASLIVAPFLSITGTGSVVLHCQEIWQGRESRILGLLARSVDRCICISLPVQNALRGSVRKKAVVIENGHRDSAQPRIDVLGRTGSVQFLIASRWNAWKGHGTLLDAWDSIESPGRLVIVGGPPAVGAAYDVVGRVRALRHPSSVSIVGEVDDIEAYIDESDFMIVPSDAPEPFGLVAIEAFSRGRGVIASNAGGLADIVTNREDGYLFTPGSTTELSEILTSTTRNAAVSFGSAARSTYEARYSIDAFSIRIAEFFAEILREKPRRERRGASK